MSKESKMRFPWENLIFFISLVALMFIFRDKAEKLFGNKLFYLYEDNILYFVGIILSLMATTVGSTKIKNQYIGVIVFPFSFMPFLVFTHVFLTILLFKMGLESVFFNFIFVIFWFGILSYFTKNFPDNIISKTSGYFIYLLIIIIVFFQLIPQGGAYTDAMIEKYSFKSKGSVIKKEKGSNRNYIVTYLFEGEDGRERTCITNESIFNSKMEALKTGDKVWVEYSTKYPEYCKFADNLFW